MIFPASDIISFLIFLFSMQNGYFPFKTFRETQINPNLALCLISAQCSKNGKVYKEVTHQRNKREFLVHLYISRVVCDPFALPFPEAHIKVVSMA